MAVASYDDVVNSVKTDTLHETDRKCPQCGGVMDFDPATGGLHCPYCDYKEAIPEANDEGEKTAEELDFESAEFTGNCDWGADKKTVTCKSCGATSVYDALQVANECPYCGSNQVMEASDVKTLAPNGAVLFKITAKQAGERFLSWIKGKWFCPRAAKESAKADKFKGVYLPYWTFDANTMTTYTAEYGIDRRVKRGDKWVTITNWHPTSGTYSEFIDDQLVSGTTAHDNSILQMIEPYNTEDNKAYKPEYMAGFAAERYSVGLKDAWENAKEFIGDRLRSGISSQVIHQYNANHVRSIMMNTRYSNITYKYLMLPVWISAFGFNGKTYQFMVNGQTGKVGGRYPISPWRVALAVLIAIAVIALFLYFSN